MCSTIVAYYGLRLRSTGVVNIEKPVNEALRLGRFQEMEDDIDEDLGGG